MRGVKELLRERGMTPLKESRSNFILTRWLLCSHDNGEVTEPTLQEITGADTCYPLERHSRVFSGDYASFMAAQGGGSNGARQWAQRHHGEMYEFEVARQERELAANRQRYTSNQATGLNHQRKPPKRKEQAA